MTTNGILQILIYCLALTLLTKPAGIYLAKVYEGEPLLFDRIGGPVERLVYRLARIDASAAMNWRQYGSAMLIFSFVSSVALYLLLRAQSAIALLNPRDLPSLAPDLAFNTAVSFVSNTNWQSYGGESTMSYLSQMLGLTVQNFVSAAVGMALAAVFIRGLARFETDDLGNFWRDLTRGIVYVLLPASFVFALFFVSQGVVQNFSPYQQATTLEGGLQTIAQGPVASQLAIKMLGTNGGGFFNANSAHPFENPTPLANFVEMLLILVIPSGFTYMLGRMTRAQKHGWAVFGAMAILFVGGTFAAYVAESRGNPLFPATVDQRIVGGNLEGKEVRFGVADSALFATATTGASCGAVNSMHSSFTPLGGLVTLVNMQLGEVVFGGVGAGLYGVLMMVVLTVFIAGLMVGRTPEYLGKKIEAFDVQMAMLYALVFPMAALALAAVTAISPGSGTGEGGTAHGLSEIVYAFTSAAANNGSAFAGLNANTPWFNTTLAIAMLAGRFLMIVPVVAVAGNLARKKYVPPSLGTFPVDSLLFTVLLVFVIVVVGELTFFPVLSLSPLLEHFQMMAGQTF